MPSTASSTPGGVASVAPGARRRSPARARSSRGVGEGDGEQPALAPGDAAAPIAVSNNAMPVSVAVISVQ